MSYDKKPAPTHAAVIDWETLSTRSNAVLPSVGVVFGNLDTGEIIDTLHITMDVQSQIDAGYHVEADTLAFWINQDQHARTYLHRILSNKFKHVSRQDGFRQLFNFLNNLPRNTRIFGNGPTFDLAICIEEWRTAGLPWEFWNERCVRSWNDLCELTIGGKVKDKVPFEGVKHHPVDDAKHEFKQMHAVLSWMRALAMPPVILNASEIAENFRDATAQFNESYAVGKVKIDRASTLETLSEIVADSRESLIAADFGKNYKQLASEFAKDTPALAYVEPKVAADSLGIDIADTRAKTAPEAFAIPYGKAKAVAASLDVDVAQFTKDYQTGGVVGLDDSTAGLDTEREIPVAISASVSAKPKKPVSAQVDLQHAVDSTSEDFEVAAMLESDDPACQIFEVIYKPALGTERTLFIVEAPSNLAVRNRLESEYYGDPVLWGRLEIRNSDGNNTFRPWPEVDDAQVDGIDSKAGE